MMKDAAGFPSRRRILSAGAFGVTGLFLPGRAGQAQQRLARTPACHDGDEPTVPETEGPFFKPRSPQRADFRERGIEGQPVDLSGYVLTRSCRPVAGAIVDLWHADNDGNYDNTGSRLRGHVFTDAEGRFSFRTIMPGLYPGRTRHYHVKIHSPGERSALTTQFYFPEERRNRSDGLFRPQLVMEIAKTESTLFAHFDVVL
jgi:protocatechuate 3,4-dioxygenase beta subunit